ncbi:DUF1996 domain-containing protein [Catellatospora chokoriensis]|uniref:DUF1996 domain-containing protein n=1 Tax=Catellatospora chokoriensis TaxID=310353 RepID=A0A8J3K3H1_9ACTN|nr:DUF1996 domain-containing protein [Catellatospora chokoriensis]GIF92416.1 hypothetical protein Cch02nite_58600 [Catellatospora chokoriensis]
MSYQMIDGSGTDPQPRPGSAGRLARNRRNVLVIGLGLAVVTAVAAGAVFAAGAPEPSNAAGGPERTAPAVAPAASASAAASPSSSAVAAKAPKPGWVPVDQAAWRAQVDAYQARKIDPVPAGVGNLPEFRADCQYSHSLPDDPIVAPGLPGASHMHSFVGNKAVDAQTKAADLMKFTATTCKPVEDHSSYWVPTLYDNATGKPVETTGFRVYYRSLMSTSANQLPMPNGLRMIVGDAKKSKPTPRGAGGQFFCAYYGPGDVDGVARSGNGNWPICDGKATLHYIMQFPDCWDGKNLDSPDHKAHVSFGRGNACPRTHPVKIPAITFDIAYGSQGSAAGFYLASDKDGKSASSMHGDAFVMWDVDAMNKRTKNCVQQRRTCDNLGYQK